MFKIHLVVFSDKEVGNKHRLVDAKLNKLLYTSPIW